MRDGSSLSLNPVQYAVNKPSVSILLEHGTPSILVHLEGRSRRLILDTGSSVSILQPGISRRDVEVTNLKPYGVTGEVLDIKGRQSVSFELDKGIYIYIYIYGKAFRVYFLYSFACFDICFNVT